MSANPLLDLLADKVAQLGRTLTSSELGTFLDDILKNPDNFENFDNNTGNINRNYKATALYSSRRAGSL
jgi:hypothetical protein